MNRLYLQIYLTFIAILLLFGLLLSIAFIAVPSDDIRGLDALARVGEELLPGPGAPPDTVASVLARLHEEAHLSAAVWSASGERIASVGDELPRPQPGWSESRVIRSRGEGFTLALAFSDGRWVVLRHRRQTPAPAGLVAFFGLLAVAVALGAYPLVRRLTGRIERLGRRVDALGAGELGARVEVEGRDEVAQLAQSFNRAIDRIERLVEAQKTLLEGVSHELRSPLARVRMALELLGDAVRPELKKRIAGDINELDALLGELLLASRLDTVDAVELADDVDLLGLAAEEASAFDADVSGEPVTVRGDVRLLRRLIRNLLSNARRHAGESSIDVSVRPSQGRALLSVADRGPGIPEDERERIFEPFFRGACAHVSSPEGTGLGLALVQRISRLHGGDVRYAPRPGGGSELVVELSAEVRDPTCAGRRR